MKLNKYKIITGTITLETGLHIGGSSEVIEIGGMDNPVIRNPISNEPYIPGSSLKGKMRSLLEWKTGSISGNGNPHEWCGDRDCPICRIFGTSSSEAEIGPTRLIVRDAFLSADSIKNFKEKGIMLTEEKYENTINRITARANPRSIERVPAGISFQFEIIYRMFEIDNMEKTDEELFNYVLLGLNLIQKDSLGGYGSRGCGKIQFIGLKDENDNELDINNLEELSL